MKLVLSEPKYFKDSISIISELVSETRIKVSNTGLTIISMDPANVAMVIFKLLSSCFSEYKVESETEIGLNLNNLKQVLKRVEVSDIMELETSDNNSRLDITVKGRVTRKFSLPMITLDDKEQKEPNLEFNVDVTMPATLLSSAIEDADVVADSVSIIGNTNKMTVSAEGDLNKVEVDIENSDEVKITNKAEATVKSKYSIEYLKKLIAGSKISDNVQISFSNDYPMKMSFVSVDKASLSFILAPRVDNE
ncbi:MAG: proliferating cell nuclear antigen (pcna) [Nanobdellota archaeon]